MQICIEILRKLEYNTSVMAEIGARESAILPNDVSFNMWLAEKAVAFCEALLSAMKGRKDHGEKRT